MMYFWLIPVLLLLLVLLGVFYMSAAKRVPRRTVLDKNSGDNPELKH